jgi:hypothetical protein
VHCDVGHVVFSPCGGKLKGASSATSATSPWPAATAGATPWSAWWTFSREKVSSISLKKLLQYMIS